MFDDEQEYILPDDFTEESQETAEVETTEETTEAVEAPEAPEVTETPTEQEPFNVITFNKTKIPVTKEEDTRLSQLGMFYEVKVQPEFERLKGIGEQYGKIEKLASLYGMTPDELHESLYNQYIATAAESEGITPEQKRKEQELIQKEQQLTAQLTESQQKQESQAMYERFMDAYPDVKVESIKPETWLKVDQGLDLVTAYTMQVNQELQQQFKQREQIDTNKKTSPSVATMSNGGAEPTKSDDFLEGLFGD